jgi:flavin reductase (DIM6/NTAB) family NADH-FMN oxidoreductase RutF
MTTAHARFDQAELRLAFGCYPSGVAAVCGMYEGQPQGLAVSSFTSVSLDPPLVSVCVAHTSSTWPTLARLRCLGVSVLAGHQGPVARSLASKTSDRFAGIAWTATDSGAVFVDGAPLWLECGIVDHISAGDHDIAVLRITSLRANPDVTPLVFHRSTFHELGAAR